MYEYDRIETIYDTYMYATKYYPTIKGKGKKYNPLNHKNTWLNLECISLTKRRQPDGTTCCVPPRAGGDGGCGRWRGVNR